MTNRLGRLSLGATAGAPAQETAGTPPEETAGAVTLEAFAAMPRLNRWLFDRLAPHVTGDVLEIGSGIGNLSALFAERARRLVVSDADPSYLARLRARFAGDPRVRVARYDVTEAAPAELLERRFDTVVAVNVLEHIEDDRAAVAALAALLAPNGKLVVYVPACPFAYGSLDRALGHHRRYTRATIGRVLAAGGLKPGGLVYMNALGLAGWALNSRILRRQRLPRVQLALFERVVPFMRLEERIPLPLGLGIAAVGIR